MQSLKVSQCIRLTRTLGYLDTVLGLVVKSRNGLGDELVTPAASVPGRATCSK